MKIYLDNAATTMTDKEVVNSMIPAFTKSYGNASSLHRMGNDAHKLLDEARKKFAEYINALPEEIIFTSGGTESDNIAIFGTLKGYRGKKMHVITSTIEHPAVLNTCKSLESEGVEVTYIEVDEDGIVDPRQIEQSIKPHTRLITIMHANNEIGTIQPIRDIGEIAKAHNIIFHSDAVQSLTKVPIDVRSMDIDMMSFSGHKIYGPKGIGALYVKKGTPVKNIMYGGSHEYKKRPGTENVPGIVGFAKALEITKTEDIEKMKMLRDRLIDGLLRIPKSRLNGSREKRLCNNANVGFEFIEGEGILMHLSEKGICVSTGSACSSNSLEPSHVLKAIRLKHEIIHGAIRFTLSRHTTEKEIDYTIKAVESTVRKLRKFSALYEGKKYDIVDDDGHDHVSGAS